MNEEKMFKLSEKKIYLAKTENSNIEALDYLVNKLGMSGIYVTCSKPCASILKEMQPNIDPSKVYFIDAITKKTDQKAEAINCSLVSGPEAITELSIMISQAVQEGKYKFLIFDSLTTMLVYNEETSMLKFTHYLINKLKLADMAGLIFFVEEEKTNKLVPVLSQFCDGTIKV